MLFRGILGVAGHIGRPIHPAPPAAGLFGA
jgi:hypothetical protein